MRTARAVFLVSLILLCLHATAQQRNSPVVSFPNQVGLRNKYLSNAAQREAWFQKGRVVPGMRSAELLHRAWQRQQQVGARPVPRTGTGGQSWTQLGPVSFSSDAGTIGIQDYGDVSGRVLSVAVDPSDLSGNTVYVGSAGGGVWKSMNAAAADPATVTWAPLTDSQPSLVSGAIAIKPDNSNILLVGTGEGDSSSDSYYGQGVLRSADGGTTWSVIGTASDGNGGTVSLRGVGFTSIAFSQDNPNLVVASTAGAVYFGSSAGAGSGAVRGLYYSNDAGQSWTLASATDSGTPVGGGSNPASATQVIYNAFTHRFYAGLRDHGVYESVDGANFTRMAVQPFAALSLANCPTNVSSGTCPFYRAQFAIQPATRTMFVIAVDGQEVSQGIAMATDAQLIPQNGPVSWTQVSDIDATLPNSGGIPSQPSGITECEGGVCRKLIQGRYNLWIAAVPSGSDTQLFVGTRDIYRCDLGVTANCMAASSWTNLTNAFLSCGGSSAFSPYAHVHADQHGAAWVSSNPSIMFFVNDGGVYRTLNGAPGDGCGSAPNPFQNLNTNLGPIAEVVGFSQHPADSSVLLAGVQNNGSPATNAALGLHWQAVNSGDGGYNEIDPNAGTDDGTLTGNPVPAGSIWYTSNSGVSIQRCVAGSLCTANTFGLPPNYTNSNIENAEVGGDSGDFYTPFRIEPAGSSLLLVGTCRLWRGPGVGGNTWNGLAPISPMFDYLVTGGTAPSACGGETNIRSIAAGGPNGSVVVGGQPYSVAKVVYAGMSSGADTSGAATAASGHIFVTKDSTLAIPVWTDITAGSGAGDAPISDIAVDAKDATGGTVYVTIMGFGLPHVLKSVDFGAHWANIAATNSFFPDIPADSIALSPTDANTIYVGTDIGVYATTNGGQNWGVFGSGLPSVPVTKLRIFGSLKLRASTFGRGIWESSLTPSGAPQITGAFDGSPLQAAQNTTITLSGWAAMSDGTAVQSVKILLDGNVIGSATLGQERSDINCLCGWTYSYNIGSLLTGPHTFTAVADNTAGSFQMASRNGAGAVTVIAGSSAPDFNLTASTTSLALRGGQSGTLGLSLTPQGGYAGPVSFSCAGLPTGASCNFNPSTVSFNGSTTADVTVTIATSPLSAAIFSAPGKRADPPSLYSAFAFSAVAIAILPLNGKRKRISRWFAMFCLMGVFAGCGGGGSSGGGGAGMTRPPTVSTVTITASGAQSGATISHQVQFTMTIN